MAKVFTITEGLENMGALKTGGQGSVYKGRRMGPIITAVKLLPTPIHSEDPNDKNYIDFQNEVNKLKKVNEEPNPNVVKILNFGITESGSFPFIEMEFIEGPDLEDLLKLPHEQIFTIKEAVKVAEQLSNALAHCHNLDVKHGDVKSNNVKFSKDTGNYILLDFGLAAMSDEQRRTSLRRAGAIEFMAPEQSEGELLFQSDVYSFGIIMFELLAGVVPFPLQDKGESARNMVMLAHIETPPPDLRELRRQHLPEAWLSEKKSREMQIPDWLVSMIYRCLRKKPLERFANGNELHEYILLHSTVNSTTPYSEQINKLEQQNQQLQRDKDQLQQRVSRVQQESQGKDQEIQRMRIQAADYQQKLNAPKKKSYFAAFVVVFIIAVLSLVGFIYELASNSSDDDGGHKKNPPRQVIGQYRVGVAKAFFYDTTNESTKRPKNFLVVGDQVNALDEQNGFEYTEFTNPNTGKFSKGWLRKQDLMTPDEWSRQDSLKKIKAANDQQEKLLQQAQNSLDNLQLTDALNIYRQLADKGVPEAMYRYADMALQSQNPDLSCDMAMAMMQRASDKGYVPAKRTLGFLYLFADNRAVLGMNNYGRCEFVRSVAKALQLLEYAASQGDGPAEKWLQEYYSSNGGPNGQ